MSGNLVDKAPRKENKIAPDRRSAFLLWLLPVAFTAALTMVVSRSSLILPPLSRIEPSVSSLHQQPHLTDGAVLGA
jgi:hypothetical protein